MEKTKMFNSGDKISNRVDNFRTIRLKGKKVITHTKIEPFDFEVIVDDDFDDIETLKSKYLNGELGGGVIHRGVTVDVKSHEEREKRNTVEETHTLTFNDLTVKEGDGYKSSNYNFYSSPTDYITKEFEVGHTDWVRNYYPSDDYDNVGELGNLFGY